MMKFCLTFLSRFIGSPTVASLHASIHRTWSKTSTRWMSARLGQSSAVSIGRQSLAYSPGPKRGEPSSPLQSIDAGKGGGAGGAVREVAIISVPLRL